MSKTEEFFNYIKEGYTTKGEFITLGAGMLGEETVTNAHVNIPLKTSARIQFDDAMSVDAEIPVKLTIPVDIPLEETSLAYYFKKMAEGLKGLTKLSDKNEE